MTYWVAIFGSKLTEKTWKNLDLTEENIEDIYYKRRGERLTLEKKKEDGQQRWQSEEKAEGAT